MARVILGVDPGLTRCGIGLIKADTAREVSLIAVDTIRTTPEVELTQRIGILAKAIESLIQEHKPDTIALERVFAQANVRSVMGVAQISGVVLMIADKYQIPVQMHTPSEVKAAVTGSGRAEKAQIGLAVTKILGLAEIPKPADSADALAIAICNAWKNSVPASSSVSLTKAQQAWQAAERVAKRKQ